MNRIESISSSSKEFKLDDSWSSYLFSDVNKYIDEKRLLDTEKKSATVPHFFLDQFYNIIVGTLKNLLDSYYTEPTAKELQKHPSRFEKIIVDNRTYRVNYRMSNNGRIAYAISCLLEFIKNVNSEGGSLTIR